MAEENLDMGTEGEGQAPAATAEEIAEAREMGWVPKEQWKGLGGAEWLDAKEFLERGRNLMPVLAATNRRLKSEQAADRARMEELERTSRAQAAALAALQEESAEDAEAQRVATVAELKTKIAEAARNGDFDQVAEATAQLAEIAQKPTEKPATTTQQQGPSQAEVEALKTWFDENPDYKVPGSPKELIARGISEQLRARGDRRVGVAFVQAVAEETEAYMARHFPGGGTVSRVAGSNGGTGRGTTQTSGQKTYADLPPDAKEYCERSARRFVGEGKKYKTAEAWRAGYAKQYFAQEGV